MGREGGQEGVLKVGNVVAVGDHFLFSYEDALIRGSWTHVLEPQALVVLSNELF
jgi:hypothetical protein